MAEFDLDVLLYMIDVCLAELGTAGLVDGRSARDKLLDVRSLVSSMKEDKEDVRVPERVTDTPA